MKFYRVIVLFVLTILLTFTACSRTTTETIIIDETGVSSEDNASVEDTTSVEEKPVVSKPIKEPVTSKGEAPVPEKTPSQQTSSVVSTQFSQTALTSSQNSDAQTSSNKSDEITISGDGENKVRHPISGLPFKEPANPDIGISWDGVSPIIYTYPDGSTGTEKRKGATYEYLPGMIGTIHDVNWQYHTSIPEPNNEPLTCTECGKELGDGTNGTCLSYWTGGDHACEHCGDIIPENTCHTCDE